MTDVHDDFARRLATARELLLAHPEWTDERIARKSRGRYGPLRPHWVAAIRHFDAGTIPALSTHREIVEWCFEAATIAGWAVHREESISLANGRRIIPDVVLADAEEGVAEVVIEVKPAIRSMRELLAAVRQVSRYADAFEDEDPTGVMAVIVTPLIAVDPSFASQRGVTYWDPNGLLWELSQPLGGLYVPDKAVA